LRFSSDHFCFSRRFLRLKPMMLTPAQASAIIAQQLPLLPSEDCPIENAHGRITRVDLAADRPLPPFDRVTMDGFAVRAADWVDRPTAPLRVVGYQAAGMIPQQLSEPGTAIEIATGSSCPVGADTVVPYEDTTHTDGEVRLRDGTAWAAGQNLHPAGSDFAAGTVLVPAGARLTGREIAVAATIGAARIRVAARPSVAVIATGDELMEVNATTIAPQQIRKSNDYAIRAALRQSELVGRVERFHLRDHRPEIEQKLREILASFDVTILTGGVSKGKRDHIPDVLAQLGSVEHLRGIAQRPGKPMWFGTTSRRTPIFALPGNPVSTYTCLHRYVLPALRQMAGAPVVTPQTVTLGQDFTFGRPLAFMLPVQLRGDGNGQQAAVPAPFNTSGDLGGLLETDGFVELPADVTEFPVGTRAAFWRWT
jgi:molybdopterin molybdotransferase